MPLPRQFDTLFESAPPLLASTQQVKSAVARAPKTAHIAASWVQHPRPGLLSWRTTDNCTMLALSAEAGRIKLRLSIFLLARPVSHPFDSGTGLIHEGNTMNQISNQWVTAHALAPEILNQRSFASPPWLETTIRSLKFL